MEDDTAKASFTRKERLRSVVRGLRFRCGYCDRHRLQFLFWTMHQARTHRNAMGERWQADVARPAMGCALVDDTVHDRGPLYYLAGFDLCSAKRSRGRIGHRAFLGDSRCVAHIRFEDGGKGRLRLQNVAGHRSDCLSVMGQ